MLQRGRKFTASLTTTPAPGATSARSSFSLGPPPPSYLSAEMQTWWSAITARHRLEAHRLKLLEAAASAWDRLTAAREQIATQGTTYTDSKSMHQPHPAIGIERDAKTVFARMIRELKLNVEGTQRRPNETFGVGWRDDDL